MENPVINNPSVHQLPSVNFQYRDLLPLWFPPLRLSHVWFHVLPVLEILPFKPWSQPLPFITTVSIGNSSNNGLHWTMDMES